MCSDRNDPAPLSGGCAVTRSDLRCGGVGWTRSPAERASGLPVLRQLANAVNHSLTTSTCQWYDYIMEFREEITLTKEEAFDLAGALHMASTELRRSGVFELAHRLDGLTEWLEELLIGGDQ